MYSPLFQIAQSFSRWENAFQKEKKEELDDQFFLNKGKERKKKVHHTLKAVIFIFIPEIFGKLANFRPASTFHSFVISPGAIEMQN